MAARRTRRNRQGGILGPVFKILCVLAVLAALTFGVTVFFKVETVEVRGNSRYSAEEIISASGLEVGDNLYRFNKNHISSLILQSLPYVEGVNINRKPPSTIVITVSEWNAVARVEPTGVGSNGTSIPQEDTDVPLEYTTQAWLISPPGVSGCKLLEPAGDTGTGIPVLGITPVNARVGSILQVSSTEQTKLDALEGLLGELNSQGNLKKVTSINLGNTQVVIGWLGRFEVHMNLNADFNYKLRALEASIPEVERLRGEGVTGTLDLTDDDGPVRYAPFQNSGG